MPKSASTSLMITLGEAHNLSAKQDFSLKENKVPSITNLIHTVHSDIRELEPENIVKFNDRSLVYKQHIFPTENNLDLLKHTKKVILIRDPKEVLYAYVRGAKKMYNGLPEGYLVDGLSKKKLLEKAQKDGFFKDICFFKEEWITKANPDNTLIVDYKDYVNRTKFVLNKIESFYNLPLTTKKVKPVKARYSRRESIGAVLKRLIIRLLGIVGVKDILKKLLVK